MSLYCGAAEIEEGSKTQVRKEVNGLGLHFLSTIMKRKRQRREKKKRTRENTDIDYWSNSFIDATNTR